MVRVIEGKNRVTGCMKEFQGESTWVSATFELARVWTIRMTRRFDFDLGFRTIGNKFYRPHKVSLLHMPLNSNIELVSSFTICP